MAGLKQSLHGISSALENTSDTMANKQQQVPYLHLAELTASQFLEIWKHFDSDGQLLFFIVT